MKPYQQFLAQWPIGPSTLRHEKIDNGSLADIAGLWSANGADRIDHIHIANTCIPGQESAGSGTVRDMRQA